MADGQNQSLATEGQCEDGSRSFGPNRSSEKNITEKGKAVSRRLLLQGGALGVSGLVLGGTTSVADVRKNELHKFKVGSGPFAHRISEEMWANLIGQTFEFHLTNTKSKRVTRTIVNMELVDSQEISFPSDHARDRKLRPCAISLLFKQPSGPPLESGNYIINHRGLGEFGMMISPVRIERFANDDIYEAVFN